MSISNTFKDLLPRKFLKKSVFKKLIFLIYFIIERLRINALNGNFFSDHKMGRM